MVVALFRSDPESRALWEKYQLSITPRFYAVLSVLLLIASIRNLVNAAPPGPAVFMTSVVVLTTIAGYYRQELFPLMSRITSFFFMPLVAWTWLEWPPGYPAPTLILLPLSALFIVFADHIVMATLFVVFAAGLLLVSIMRVPADQPSQYELLLAFAVTTGMLYSSAVLLWGLLHRLFRSRAELSGALESSLALRQSLLAIFFDKLAAPVAALEKQMAAPAIAWQTVDDTAAEIRAVLTQARKITLDLGTRLQLDAGKDERELEEFRAQVWTALLVAAFISSLGIIVAGLTTVLDIGPLEISAALILCMLIVFGAHRGMSARGRIAAVYLLVGLIAAACMTSIARQTPPYEVLYFFVPLFCAAFVGSTLHSTVIALIAAGFLGIWYVAYPPLSGTPGFMRSNIVLGLVFMLAFSHIVWTWLRQLLSEVKAYHDQLRRESETRHRLMATLFHDIANPLQVIHGNAELALQDRGLAPDVALLRNLTRKIRALVTFTRDFEALEKCGGELPVEPVSLASIFADLRAAFSDMLMAKQLTLTIDPVDTRVVAHAELLGTSVLSNLLTNAIKFSPRGGAIRITTRRQPDRRIRIGIHDEGGGMPEAAVRQLRNGETVGSTPGTDGETGDGQGLRLVTLYLNRMNGTLVAEAGAPIAVELPLAD